MLDGLAQYLGTGYELVLHSLEDLEHSAIRVMNSHTGRSEGAPITELALTMLGRIHAQTQGDTVCYSSTNRDGKPLRSCTIAIRGSEQRIIGLLCINFYMDTPLSQLLETISPAQSQPVAETYVQNSTEMGFLLPYSVRQQKPMQKGWREVYCVTEKLSVSCMPRAFSISKTQ